MQTLTTNVRFHGIHEVTADVTARAKTMAELASKMWTLNTKWSRTLSDSSLAFYSPDKLRTVKIDACRIYTMDVKQKDGTYKSSKFTCKTTEQAWMMLEQAIKCYDRSQAKGILG